MQSLAAKTAVGLPSLLPSSRRGPKCTRSSSSGKGITGPRLARTWTLRSRPGAGDSSTATAALPFAFMEISVSVLDTLDVLRSSVEEEVVFQATLNVPAHHAMACRIEAYDSPFARAPALSAAPEHLSEQDRQFAACLASPPDLDEAHQVNLQRTADNNNASFVQRSAPSLRFASGVLTVSLSLKQRSSDLMNETEGQDDDFDLSDLDRVTRVPSAVQHTGTQAHADSLRQHSSLATAGSSDSNSSSSSGGGGAVGHRQSRLVPACVSIPEEAQELGPNKNRAPAAAAAAPAAVQTTSSSDHRQQQQPARPTGLLRVQSFTANGRHVSEVPFTTQLANKGIATLLGVGYMMLHALEARTQPHTQFWQHQVQVDGFAGRPTAAATEWVPAPVKSRV